jgi:DNA-binding Xre family transcriptional regulator
MIKKAKAAPKKIVKTTAPPPEPEAVAIGKRIAYFRDLKKDRNKQFDDAAFGKAIGKTKFTIQKLINGSACRGFYRLAEIATALDVTPNDLLGVESQGVPRSLQGAIAASYLGFDLSPEDSEALARSVLQISQDAPALSARGDRELSVRIQSETSTRAFLAALRRAT